MGAITPTAKLKIQQLVVNLPQPINSLGNIATTLPWGGAAFSPFYIFTYLFTPQPLIKRFHAFFGLNFSYFLNSCVAAVYVAQVVHALFL